MQSQWHSGLEVVDLLARRDGKARLEYWLSITGGGMLYKGWRIQLKVQVDRRHSHGNVTFECTGQKREACAGRLDRNEVSFLVSGLTIQDQQHGWAVPPGHCCGRLRVRASLA
mmetsp:Transcript_89112/g.237866  ORF Transcript_89112/g.237866 Transcript_89112/m.237866 type:complete len:113 (-) Transcript_89112:1468-1806(-)